MREVPNNITLVSLDFINGGEPWGSLIADANGDLFGIASFGGASGYGAVFEIAKVADGYASNATALASFDYTTSGGDSFGSLIADANGNLFGTTFFGGA